MILTREDIFIQDVNILKILERRGDLTRKAIDVKTDGCCRCVQLGDKIIRFTPDSVIGQVEVRPFSLLQRVGYVAR